MQFRPVMLAVWFAFIHVFTFAFAAPVDLEGAMAMMREDPETYNLVADTGRRVRAYRPAELLTFVQIDEGLLSGPYNGTVVGGDSYAYMRSLSPNETSGSAVAWSDDVLAARDAAFESRETTTETLHLLETLPAPSVHIRPGLSRLDTYSTLVHELTHLRGYAGLDVPDASDYRGANDYVERTLIARGGELEAYTAEGRALRRLQKRTGVASNNALLAYFDAEGVVRDRAGLKAYILDRLGYRTKLTNDFYKELDARRRSAVGNRDWHAQKLRPAIAPHAARSDFYRDYLRRIDAELDRLESRINYIEFLLSQKR